MAITITTQEQQETNTIESINISSTFDGYSSQFSTIPALTTVDLSNLTSSNISVSNGYSIGTGTGIGYGHQNVVWTTNNTSAIGGIYANPALEVNQGGKVSLKGEGADIDINGKSLKTWMEKVEERLNILTPNTELEKDWDDLRRLGERYRKLEKKCKEKAEVWKKLKEMPPPRLD